MQNIPKPANRIHFFDIRDTDVNIKFFFTMLRNYIASATLMAIGVIYMSTEKLHLLDTLITAEWINVVLGWSLILTGLFLCLVNIYQSHLVLKALGLPKILGLLVMSYLSFAGLIVIIGVERRLLQALELLVK